MDTITPFKNSLVTWTLVALLAGVASARQPAPSQPLAALTPVHYDLKMELDYAGSKIYGEARIELSNKTSKPVRQVSFLLYRLMRAQRVSDPSGKPIRFTQTVTAFADFDVLQVNHVKITLPQPVAAGRKTTVKIEYGGYLMGYAETGMLYVKDRIERDFTIIRPDAFGYPVPGLPSFKALRSMPEPRFTYKASILVPKDLVVANGGQLVGKKQSGEQSMFLYASSQPSWRMDFAVARYEQLSSDALRVFFLPGDMKGAQAVLGAAEKALAVLGEWFGPRNHESRLTFIEIPDGWGSQADVATVLQSAAAFMDAKSHREVYHEISHLWDVPSRDRPSPRWNEGLASFLEYLLHQHISGEPAVDGRASVLFNWLKSEVARNPNLRQVPMVHYGREGMTDYSYSTGALFFDLLYRLAGEEAFKTILRDHRLHFRDGGSSDDLASTIRRTLGSKGDLLVREWLFTTRWCERVGQAGRVEDLQAVYRR